MGDLKNSTAMLTAAFLLLGLWIAGTRVLEAAPADGKNNGDAAEEQSPVATAQPAGSASKSSRIAAQPPVDTELQQSVTNLRNIMSAVHVYHDVAGHYPAARNGWGYDLKTKEWFRQRPYLSWRVLILPFLGEKELFAKFRMNEPWDSENNRKLIPLMPKIYRAPGSKAAEGKTNYLGAVGPNAAFPATGAIMVQDFTDGTSMTIMLVEVPDDAAVEWTRPVDFSIGAKDPVKRLVGLRKGSFLTAFADAAPHLLLESIPPELLQLLLIRNDGQVVDWETLRAWQWPVFPDAGASGR